MNVFHSNIKNIYGARGIEWLRSIPKLVDDITAKLGLTTLKPVPNLSYHYVASGFQGETPIILKLGLDIEALKKEAFALKCFENHGAVRVKFEDDGLLLLERALTGISLKSYFPKQERESIEIACKVMQRLHQATFPHKHFFPHIKTWISALDKDLDIPLNYLKRARDLRDQLLASSGSDMLLHGDLHHDNILQNGKTWRAIDPKGIIGDPAYEVAAFVHNPIPELLTQDNAIPIIQKRISIFAEILNLPIDRIASWSFVQGVLAWAWALEDNCDVNYWARLTKILAKI